MLNNQTTNDMENLVRVIEKTAGKFFTVVFVKKDGSERVLNGRVGVKKHLSGGRKTVDESRYLTVYDVKSGGYRSVNKETIREVRFGGEVLR